MYTSRCHVRVLSVIAVGFLAAAPTRYAAAQFENGAAPRATSQPLQPLETNTRSTTTTAQPTATPTNTVTYAAAPAAKSTAEIDAERAEVWNSPQMLRARAWLKDYCSKSAKVTPEEAKEYEAELANMSPKQMKIWLMKFEEEEQQRQQQYSMYQQGNEAQMQQALAAQRQTQQAYSAMNKASTAAAQNYQQNFDEQRQNAQSNADARMMWQQPYYSPWGYGTAPYAGYGGAYSGAFSGAYGAGGVHYHYHYGN